jgi:hypothetical protein
LAVDFFHDAAWDASKWMDAHTKIEWCAETECYITTQDPGYEYKTDSDSDWEMMYNVDNGCTTLYDCMDDASSDDSEYDTDNDAEDVSWMMSSGVASTWKLTDEGVRSSTRLRYQQHPIQNPS